MSRRLLRIAYWLILSVFNAGSTIVHVYLNMWPMAVVSAFMFAFTFHRAKTI